MPGHRTGEGTAQRAQRHPDRPGGARATGETRHLAIGDDLPPGHPADDPVDETEEGPGLDGPVRGRLSTMPRGPHGLGSPVVRATSEPARGDSRCTMI